MGEVSELLSLRAEKKAAHEVGDVPSSSRTDSPTVTEVS